jgi:hypothetical protein
MIPDVAPTGEQMWPAAGHSGSIDKLAGVSIGFGVAALVAWIGAVWVTEVTRHDDNGIMVVLVVGVAVTLTMITGGFAAASGIRSYVHHLIDQDMAVVCRKLDRIADRFGHPVPQSVAPSGGDITEGMRGYLAGKMDFNDGP